MDERRVLLAIFLAFLVVYGWQALKPVPKPGTPAPGAPAAATTPAAPVAGQAPAAETPAAPAPAAETPAPARAPAAAALVAETAERDVRVETRDVIAVFTNRGARLKSWRLKRYLNAEREPQELVEHAVASQPLPFTLRASNEATTTTLNTALYAVSGAPAASVESSPVDLRFEYRDSAGLHAVKAFHLEPSAFVIAVDVAVTEGERGLKPAIVWGPALGDVAEVSRYTTKAAGIVFQNGKVARLDASAIAKQPVYEGDFKYAGVDDNYFMTAALQPGEAKVTFQPVAIPPAEPKGAARELMSYSIEPRTNAPQKFFVGPKDFDLLTALDPDVARAINFGTFTVIVVPLL